MVKVDIKPDKDDYRDRFFYRCEQIEKFIKRMIEQYPMLSKIITGLIIFLLIFVTVVAAVA